MERDKLKDLLLEYIDSIGQQERWEIKTEEIISKKFGFIKWLVENDKINFNKVEKNLTSQECLGILIDRGYYTNVVLMLLAISDTPIEDLISYLK